MAPVIPFKNKKITIFYICLSLYLSLFLSLYLSLLISLSLYLSLLISLSLYLSPYLSLSLSLSPYLSLSLSLSLFISLCISLSDWWRGCAHSCKRKNSASLSLSLPFSLSLSLSDRVHGQSVSQSVSICDYIIYTAIERLIAWGQKVMDMSQAFFHLRKLDFVWCHAN